MNNKLKIIVTGSSGLIGTRLCEKLIEQNHTVIGLDKIGNKWNEKVNKCTIIGDLLDEKTFNKLPTDINMLVHLAANARVYKLVKNPDLSKENFLTTFNCLEFCRTSPVPKFIFASSKEVYGSHDIKSCSEDDARINGVESSYAATKIGGEALTISYLKSHKVNYIICRFCTVYGKYDETDRFIPTVIKLAKNNKDIVIYGDNKISDFTYIDDAVDGLILSVNNFDDIRNDSFNISTGIGTKLLAVAELIKQKLQSNSRILVRDSRSGETTAYVGDIQKARVKLGYEPQFSIEEGINKAIEWYHET